MIHVFLVVHNFSGALTYSDQLALYLSKENGLNVYKVYLGSKIYTDFNVVSEDNIECIYFPRSINKEYNVKYYDRVALLLYAKYKHLNNVVFHLNAQEQYCFGKRIKEFFNCHLIYTLHFLDSFYSFVDKTNLFVDFSENELFGKIAELADQIICVTNFAQRAINKSLEIEDSKTTVIYNGMSFSSDVFDNSITDKCKYGFNAEDKLILYAGQLEPRKGIDKLIQAFLIIKDKHPTTKLIIAGTGLYDSYLPLTQTCMGRIGFVGKLDKKTLYDFYSFCEIGIIPSQFEQCSYVAIEIMFSKLPLIISDVPGLNELVIHRQTGLVCKTNASETLQATLETDECDLAVQLEYALENPEEIKKMAKKAFHCTLDRHTLESMGEKTTKVYKKVIMQPAGKKLIQNHNIIV